jgi:uncharacterized protein (TIGR02611 family)
MKRWFHQTGSLVLGWMLVVAGLVLMPLPGPGMLVLVAGMALLAQHYSWARRLLDPLKQRAIEAAQSGVETPLRIALSAAGATWLLTMGVIWLWSPTIPVFDLGVLRIGPELPGGAAAGVGLVTSGAVAAFLLGYSVWRWGPRPGRSG